jgi:hypothetical protein
MTTDTLSKLERRLAETFDELWSGFVDPREPYADDPDGSVWLALDAVGNSSRCAGFADERQLAALRTECRALAVLNEFAVNGHENRVSYIVGGGHVYRAALRKDLAGPTHLAVEAQRVVDEFLRVNRWQQRQQEIVLRMDRDGEAFLRFFTGPGGMTHVRFIEPDQVYAPTSAAGDTTTSFGIVCDPHDVETVTAYYVDGRAVDAASIQHRKANVDANVKRGLPLFFPVRKNLRRAEKLLRNMSTVAEIQSAIALIRKHGGASRTAVQQFVMAQNDGAAANSINARSSSIRRYAPGTILDAYGNVDYDFPASSLNAASYVAVLQAELRAIAARLVMPEFMLTSDASNGNFASTLVAESPALRIFERLQARQIADDRAVIERVLENAVAAGRLSSEVLAGVEIQIEPPSLAVRDAKAEAERREIEFANGILSPQTWSQKSGLDYDREQANLAAHQKSQPAKKSIE